MTIIDNLLTNVKTLKARLRYFKVIAKFHNKMKDKLGQKILGLNYKMKTCLIRLDINNQCVKNVIELSVLKNNSNNKNNNNQVIKKTDRIKIKSMMRKVK